jgi:hypothetical protein
LKIRNVAIPDTTDGAFKGVQYRTVLKVGLVDNGALEIEGRHGNRMDVCHLR